MLTMNEIETLTGYVCSRIQTEVDVDGRVFDRFWLLVGNHEQSMTEARDLLPVLREHDADCYGNRGWLFVWRYQRNADGSFVYYGRG